MFGNRVTEKDLREWFSNLGWDGQSARFAELELVAIERPGWVQIFRFSCSILDPTDQIRHVDGYCRDDERAQRFEVVYGESLEDLHETFTEWSSGLITNRVQRRHPVVIGLLLLFGMSLLLVLVLSFLEPAGETD